MAPHDRRGPLVLRTGGAWVPACRALGLLIASQEVRQHHPTRACCRESPPGVVVACSGYFDQAHRRRDCPRMVARARCHSCCGCMWIFRCVPLPGGGLPVSPADCRLCRSRCGQRLRGVHWEPRTVCGVVGLVVCFVFLFCFVCCCVF